MNEPKSSADTSARERALAASAHPAQAGGEQPPPGEPASSATEVADDKEAKPGNKPSWPIFVGGMVAGLVLVSLLALVSFFFGTPKIDNRVSVALAPAASAPLLPASAPPAPTPPKVAAVDPTQNSGKLITGEFCTLKSDGTAITIESLVAYAEAKNDFARKRISAKALEAAAENAKPKPQHHVIAEIPASMLADGVTCDDWRRARAPQLVLGVRKSSS